jgi:hypothetical protein
MRHQFERVPAGNASLARPDDKRLMSLDLSSRQFVSEAEHGSLYVGSPETVARNGAGDYGVAVETVRLRPSARQPR